MTAAEVRTLREFKQHMTGVIWTRDDMSLREARGWCDLLDLAVGPALARRYGFEWINTGTDLTEARAILDRFVRVFTPPPAPEREDYSWSEVATKDAAGLCPSSPGYAGPHIVTDGKACDECGASVPPDAGVELPEDRVAAYLDAAPNPNSDVIDEYGHGPDHRGLSVTDVRDVLTELTAARAAAKVAEALTAVYRAENDDLRGRLDVANDYLETFTDPAPQGDPIETEND